MQVRPCQSETCGRDRIPRGLGKASGHKGLQEAQLNIRSCFKLKARECDTEKN